MKVSIVRCGSYEKELVCNSVRKAIQDIGFDIKKGTKVLIKPNVLGQYRPEQCITTHPAVVEAVVKIFLENKCSVTIGESSGFYVEGGTNKAFGISGMKGISEKYNVPLVNLETVPVKRIDDDKAVVYKNPEISGLLFDADLIVNLPKLKTHTLVKYTGAVKNLFGTVPGGRKQRLHALAQKEEKFGHVLVDIFQNIKPGLNIMDAVIGIEGNGPGSSGTRKETGMLLASENAAALDIIASEIIGYNAMDIITNRYCVERGLVDAKDIQIVGEKRIVNYKKPVNVSRMPNFLIRWFMNQAPMLPYAVEEKCRRCGVCAKICPMDAIQLKPYPRIDRKKCINCYCCHETCPYGAMDLKGSAAVEFLRKVKNIVLRPGKDEK